MRYKFHIVIDLLPSSIILQDSWTSRVVKNNDIFCKDDPFSVQQSSAPQEDEKLQKIKKQFAETVDKRVDDISVIPIDLDSSSKMQSPRAKFLGSGVIHLYREGEDLDSAATNPVARSFSTSSSSSSSRVATSSAVVEESGSQVLAILAVPGYMTASDLLGFVGKDARETVSHFRMLQSAAPNRYLVLMKFREQVDADAFYTAYNRKAFNSMEPETCHVVYIHSIRFHRSTFPEFPYLLDDDFTPLADSTAMPSAPTDKEKRKRTTSMVLAKPTPPPTRSLRELPTCPVCLERMDSSVTGLLTIICQHTFHCQCLAKWGDNSCPVCRYSQKKDQQRISDHNKCSRCGALENLWICLICGVIGCGRYDEAHAFQHYTESGHVYAMDIESQRVWDYASDQYVHRLIQNQADGKLVELPSGSSQDHDGGGRERLSSRDDDYVPREKLDNIGMEYTYLLTSQLDSQRMYFEDKIAAAADKASAALAKAEIAEREAAEAHARLKQASAENDNLKIAEKEYEKTKRKAEALQTISKKLEKEWREEKSMNENMVQKLVFLTKEREEKDKEINELKEQLRDVMLYLDAQQKFQGMEEDVQQGTVTVAPSPSSKKKKGHGKH
ncbi:BRCA1-associated protein 2-domain-containing protein [Kockiozyma suomiensis]|uniref:BRCA1-associated protein 2-domain-containing protein n=1 Tax=Kockiozyma suomiensis TaxID=1337062 RepID=UPI00334376B2